MVRKYYSILTSQIIYIFDCPCLIAAAAYRYFGFYSILLYFKYRRISTYFAFSFLTTLTVIQQVFFIRSARYKHV